MILCCYSVNYQQSEVYFVFTCGIVRPLKNVQKISFNVSDNFLIIIFYICERTISNSLLVIFLILELVL